MKLFFFIALLLFFFSSASPESDTNLKQSSFSEISHKQTQIEKLTNGEQEKPVDEKKETESLAFFNLLLSQFNNFLKSLSLSRDSTTPIGNIIPPMVVTRTSTINSRPDERRRAAKKADHDDFVENLMPQYKLTRQGYTLIRTTVGEEWYLVLEGKKQFENGTMNDYKWEVVEEESEMETLRASVVWDYRMEEYDDIPDLFYLNVVAIEPGQHQLTVQYIRDSDRDVKETVTVDFVAVVSNTLFINGRNEWYINSSVGNKLTFFVDAIDGCGWAVDASSSTSVAVGQIGDADEYESVTYHGSELKSFSAVPTTEGTNVLVLVCENENGDIIGTSTVTMNVE